MAHDLGTDQPNTYWDTLNSLLDDGLVGDSPVVGPIVGFMDKGGQVFNVKAWGAKGDSVADDTLAIQVVLNLAAAVGGTVFFPTGTYIITNNLWVFGHVDMTGAAGATLLLNGALVNNWAWIVFGSPGYGGVGGSVNRWSGTVDKLTFKASAAGAQSGNFCKMLMLTNVSRGIVDNCVIDVTATGASKLGGIGAANDAFYATSPSRSHIAIRNNTCLAAQNTNGNEGISTDGATDVAVLGNYVFGFGDDGIADHSSSCVVIAHNRVYTIDGHIDILGTSSVIVSGNYVERIKTQDGSNVWASATGLIEVAIESGDAGCANDFTVVGNVCKMSPDTSGATTDAGINILAAHRGSVTGNTIINPAGVPGTGRSSITWGSVNLAGYVDPDGLDPAGVATTRDMTVAGNTPIGAFANQGQANANPVNVRHDFTAPYAVPFSATPNFQAGFSSNLQITLTGNVTSSALIEGWVGQELSITWIQDATGSRTYVWPTNCRFNGGTAPAASTAPHAMDTVKFRWNGTVWCEIARAINVQSV